MQRNFSGVVSLKMYKQVVLGVKRRKPEVSRPEEAADQWLGALEHSQNTRVTLSPFPGPADM